MSMASSNPGFTFRWIRDLWHIGKFDYVVNTYDKYGPFSFEKDSNFNPLPNVHKGAPLRISGVVGAKENSCIYTEINS